MKNVRWIFAVGVVAGSWVTEARGQMTQRVSLFVDGTEAPVYSSAAVMTPDGRYIGFHESDGGAILVRDRLLGTTEEIVGPFDGNSGVSISGDGRYVAFSSRMTTLVPDDSNGMMDVFVRDRVLGSTVRASVSTAGVEGGFTSTRPAISTDGRYVAFTSGAANLVAGDTNGVADVFVRDLQAGTTERVSIDSMGNQANHASDLSKLDTSADGRFVLFTSRATNLVPGDTNLRDDLFLRDRTTGITECVSVASDGTPIGVHFLGSSMSADGRYVAFRAYGQWQSYVRDRQNGTTEPIGLSSTGQLANAICDGPSISDDGRYVSFSSMADNLVPGDVGSWQDVFIRDRVLQTTGRVSVNTAGVPANSHSGGVGISSDGRYVLFQSWASNLVPETLQEYLELYVHDRAAASFTSLCEPGVLGVAACPCANPPSGSGRGCNNSAATGGAVLAASGIAYLSNDTLVFTTSGEKPTATSVVLQGTTLAASGIVYGQGIRCLGGTLKRLYAKAASGGSITAPDIEYGDEPVSVRSQALGNPITAGSSRWYLVFYRDPIVLGGCPATSTFNATQTGRIDWSP